MQNENNKWLLRTDLAYDKAQEYNDENLEGLKTACEDVEGINIICHQIDEPAASILQKAPGIYYTIDLTNLNYHDHIVSDKIENALSKIIKELLDIYNLHNKSCLVVGLGNDNVTPDAIGPYVVDNIVVTRHLQLNNQMSEGYAVVSAISPGVMGTTGIETYDIIESVRNKIDVDYIIVVDALASSDISRVNRTIQVTDTGISPGSGVGNKRKEISFKTMRIPVIAVGIPTVVDAVSIASNTINYVLKYLNLELENNMPKINKLSPTGIGLEYEKLKEPTSNIKEHFLGQVGLLSEAEQKQLFMNVLTPNGYNLMVTSKDIDLEVEDLSKIVAWGLNKALHKSISLSEGLE